MNYRLSSTLLTIFVMKFGQGHFQKFIHNNNDFEEVPINNTVTNIAKLSLRHLRHHLGFNLTCELKLNHILSAQLSSTQGKTYVFDYMISFSGSCKYSPKLCRFIIIYIPKKCYKSEELCEVLIGKDRIMCTSFDKHFFKPNTNHFEVKNTTFYQPDINEQLHLASKSVKFLYHYFSTSTFCPMELKKISNMTSMRGGGTYYKFNLDLQTIPIEKGCEKEYRRCENVHIFKPNEKNCKLLDYDCLFPLDAAKVNCSTKKNWR